MNKDESNQWKKLQDKNKGIGMKKFYTGILWVSLLISLSNGVMAGLTATSAIHQIYGGISYIIATLLFCTLAIMSKISEESEYIVTASRTLKETIIKEAEAFKPIEK